jgi:hypothetical protein
MLFSVESIAGQIAVLAVAAAGLGGFLLWSRRFASWPFFSGALSAVPVWMAAIHYRLIPTRSEVVLAFTLFPVTSPSAMLLVLLVAVAVLVGFLVWSKRVASNSFFLGVLAGTGLVLSFDIIWVHWIFGLHHLTNTRMDLVLEPLLVVLGIGFLWFGIRRELRQQPAR